MKWAYWAAIAVLGCGPRSTPDGPPDGGQVIEDAGRILRVERVADVERIVDGDTLVVRAGPEVLTPDGRPLDGERVRLLGVDTPELRTPDGPECFAVEAQRLAIAELDGRRITLQFDETRCRPPQDVAACRGDFGRLLAYIEYQSADDQPEVFNEVLLRTGHAAVLRGSRFRHRQSARYDELERTALMAGLGLWACP
ncbi:MAG: thermonuclease family protein [Myxococcota bacterium]